jgi:DtxR family Mn-dependent transcriptional regulator
MTKPLTAPAPAPLSSSLEDYLETIYLLVQDQGFARVKEIASARNVKAPSVSIALRRLAEQDLVRYERREYVVLTEAGEKLARRVYSRHRLLTRFFEEVLQMPAEAAAEQACALEHGLTDEAMAGLARFFEFVGSCPQAGGGLLERFRSCPIGLPKEARGAAPAVPNPGCSGCDRRKKEIPEMSELPELSPGESAKVAQVRAEGHLRQRLLDMGILPDTPVELERVGRGGDPLWIRCQGAQLALRRSEAKTILVVRD